MSQEPRDGKRTAPIEMTILAVLVVAFLLISIFTQFVFRDVADPLDYSKSVGIIVAAGLTLVMYSFLYRDNAAFKIAENLYVGVGLGYTAIGTWRQSLRPEVYEPFFNAPTLKAFENALLFRAVPIILGILLLTRLSRKHSWLSRYTYVLLIGWGAGIAIPVAVHSYIIKQLYAAIEPLQAGVAARGADQIWWAWFLPAAFTVLGTVIVMVGTVAVLFYFFFSVEHKRVGAVVSRVGIIFLMVAFGASFGYTVMGRMSLLIGRVQFLLFDWLKISQ